MKVRGQNYGTKIGKFHLEQTNDGSFMVKLGGKGYVKGIFDTRQEAVDFIKNKMKEANEKRKKVKHEKTPVQNQHKTSEPDHQTDSDDSTRLCFVDHQDQS